VVELLAGGWAVATRLVFHGTLGRAGHLGPEVGSAGSREAGSVLALVARLRVHGTGRAALEVALRGAMSGFTEAASAEFNAMLRPHFEREGSLRVAE